MPLMPGASVEYFIDMRPGYEAAYDVDRDRFGNATTGFSGGAPGLSPSGSYRVCHSARA